MAFGFRFILIICTIGLTTRAAFGSMRYGTQIPCIQLAGHFARLDRREDNIGDGFSDYHRHCVLKSATEEEATLFRRLHISDS